MAELRYKTKPLECWQWGKELRAKHYQDIRTAKEQGKTLVSGGAAVPVAILGGLGDWVYLQGEPWGASIATSPELALQCAEAVEAHGYSRDLCGYMRNYWGSMFANVSPFGGEFPRPDFAWNMHICDSHGKWFQVVSEYLGIPYFAVDMPCILPDESKKEHAVQYLVSQFHDFIEWMEKVTGRPYDDEKFIEAIYTSCCSRTLWAQICELNKAIPAPLEQKSMLSLYMPGILIATEKEAIDFYQALKDEVQDRVEQQIAAVPNERFRLVHDSVPPWYFLRFFRHAEKYGAVFVGSLYGFMLGGDWEYADGALRALKDPKEEGVVLKNREEAVRFLAEWALRRIGIDVFAVQARIPWVVSITRDWHAQGVAFHINRGCEGLALGQMEIKRAIQEQLGLSTMVYEGNMADRREFSESQVVDQLESFLESIGLTQIKE